jgi:hypothetical protein
MIDGARGHIRGNRADRQARGQLGVDAVHRRFVGLHAPRESDGLVGRPPRPAGLCVIAARQRTQQRCRRLLAQYD